MLQYINYIVEMAFNVPLVSSKSHVLNLSTGHFLLVSTSEKEQVQTESLVSVVLHRPLTELPDML